MITTTATDIQNNFGKYLKAVQEGNEIISGDIDCFYINNGIIEKNIKEDKIWYSLNSGVPESAVKKL